MISKLRTVFRLVFGQWTPFLLPAPGRRDVQFSEGEDLKALIAKDLDVDPTQIALSASGRSAIYAVLSAIPKSEKTEVICTSFSCSGVIDPIISAGFTPVFADIDEDLQLTLEGFRDRVSSKTLAVIVPHLCGMWNKHFQDIFECAKNLGIVVIEDAAQAEGLEFAGTKTGCNGDFSIFSFGVGKLASAPLGGAIVSHSDIVCIADSDWTISQNYNAQCYSVWRGLCRHPWRRGLGKVFQKIVTSKNGGVASGVAKDGRPLKLDGPSANIVIEHYATRKQKIDQIRHHAEFWVQLIKEQGWDIEWSHAKLSCNTCLKFWIKLPTAAAAKLKLHLWKYGIEVEDLYTPLHLKAEFSQYRSKDLPVTEKVYQMVFCLPVRPNLTKFDLERFEFALRQFSLK